jgi:hypothetical protein
MFRKGVPLSEWLRTFRVLGWDFNVVIWDVGNTAGEDWYFVRRDYFIRSRNENIFQRCSCHHHLT